MSAKVYILHATEWEGLAFLSGPTRLTVAYEYEPDDPFDLNLETIFRQNNTVDGTERNVEHEARSLSVGDVVMITNEEGAVSCHMVDKIGFRWMNDALVSALLDWADER